MVGLYLSRPKNVEPDVVFKAMAERTRQRALTVLHRHELSVSELVDVLRQPQSTVSRHLRILREAGLIRDRRDGTTVLYAATDGANAGYGSELVAKMLAWVAEQPLPAGLNKRLDVVMHRRRQMSDRFFHELGRHWDNLREESFGAAFHLEAAWALLPPEWVVADIGAGTGYLLAPLANCFQRVIGVDPVEKMLEAARHRVAQAGLDNVDLRCGDLSDLPIPDATVDLAVAALVLHHVPSPQEALAELHRIARPGGRALIVEQAAHENETFRDHMQDRWFGFEPDDLAGRLESVGFKDVRSLPLTSVERAADAPELFVVTGGKLSDRRDDQR